MAVEAAAVSPGLNERAERRPRRRRRRELGGYGRELAPPLTPSQAQAAHTLNDAMRSLLSAGGGAYLKIFRTSPLPPTFQGQLYQIETIRSLEGITDHAEHIRQLGLASGWASGTFDVHGWIEGGAEPQFRLPLAFEFPVAAGTAPGPMVGAPPSPTEQIKQVGELVTAVKAVTGESASADTLARMFTAGVAAGKGPDTTSPMLAMLMPVIGKVVERLMTPPPPPPPPEDHLDRTLLLMERLGFRRPDPAPTGLAQISEAMSTARTVLDAASGLAGPAGRADAAPRVSGWVAWAQTFQIVAPLLGQAISQVTQSVNNVVEARKLEHLARATTTRPAAASITSASPFAGFEHAMTEGIHTPEVFQALSASIARMGHGGLIDAIRAGQVTAEAILAQAGDVAPELRLPGGQEFVEAYVAWLASSSADGAEATPATVEMMTVQCTRCRTRSQLRRGTSLATIACACGGPVVQIAHE